MYNCNTDSLGLILGVEVFFSEGHCSGALWLPFRTDSIVNCVAQPTVKQYVEDSHLLLQTI